jgi:hypothetical protein
MDSFDGLLVLEFADAWRETENRGKRTRLPAARFPRLEIEFCFY